MNILNFLLIIGALFCNFNNAKDVESTKNTTKSLRGKLNFDSNIVKSIDTNSKCAVVVIDMQRDFVDGSLPVPGAFDIIDNINHLVKEIECDFIITTGDRHQEGDSSFASTHGVKPFSLNQKNETLWPDHCVEGTHGIELHENLFLPPKTTHFYKPDYSILSNNTFAPFLEKNNINTLIITGVAGEICVEESAKDLTQLGKNVIVWLPGIGWLDEPNKNSTIIKMINRKNTVVEENNYTKQLCELFV